MKKALLKDSVKEIKNTYKRFISIMLMAFLGVGFFAGIRATSPDMVDTIDKYYDEQNVFDIQIISTLGLTEEDLNEISKIEDVENVQGSYETDGKIEINNKEIVTKFITIGKLNQPILLEGNLPQAEDECVVEESFLTFNNKQIGDKVQVEIGNTKKDDGEEISYLKQEEMKIVGVVKSPLYISRDRGTSKLGSGKVNYYIYIPQENINAKDIYTSIYVQVKDAKKYTTSSDEYEEHVNKVKNNIEEIKAEREQARRNQLVDIANKKVIDAENELNTKKIEAQQKIEEAEKEIKNGKSQIQNAENEINKNKKKADVEFANAQTEINNYKSQIDANEKKLLEKEQEASKSFEELEKQKQELQINLNQVDNGLQQVQIQYNAIAELLKDTTLSEDQKQIYEMQKKLLDEQITKLKQNRQTIEEGIAQIENGITAGKQEIENGKNQIQTAKNELTKKESQFNQTKKLTYIKIETAKQELERSKQELAKGEEELNNNKQEFEQKIADSEKELIDAKEKILKIENPTWYILDRNSNVGYVGFIQDTKSIANIGRVFPIVFFIVATLISLTSMTRMVEEQRMQIGTLKALGYNKLQITSKYVIYASLACVVGAIFGMCVGFVILPKIIWMMYGMMYQLPDISISFNLKYGGMGLIFISVCIIGATIYTILKELINTPANLMRPKAPKMGNRVFLERIPFIWKHLNFSQKVTVRNLFRYKKRFYMTIIGILGCTALILTGFGVKDSVKKIVPNQYENVFQYDMQISLKDSLEEIQRQEFISNLNKEEKITKIAKVYMTSGTVINGKNSEDVQIIVPSDENELDGIINIKDVKKKEKINLKENEICLTDKAAQLLEVKSGDTITLKDADEKEVQIKISNIVENYVSHYVYMSKQTYENIYKKDYTANVLLTKNNNLTSEEQDELATEIMNQNEVASVSNISSMVEQIDDMMSLLNYVVVVLIVSAGLLAFVVLYNLSNVNISERIRELATIKVLGFYDKEVYKYVTRETVILTVIGIILGLIGGYFLNYYIMGTCEINILRFSKTINPISYVYAVIITVVFTVIVNIATYFALKKIDMIENLKSVE